MAQYQLTTTNSHELAAETTSFQGYLEHYGLPTENVIASSDERRVVGQNLPSFLSTLSAEQKRDALYLSKFIGASAVGLFDASLNYVWNEVVLNLRKKVVVYGIDLFYDAAVGGSARADYKDENDLPGIKDRVLLDTCRKLELVSDIVYRKLDHILEMRNEVAASHPNVGVIGGFELLGWLQTCVRDVLQDQPSESSIRIKALVANLKSSTNLLDAPTVARFADEVRHLALPHLQNLTLSIFYIHCTPATDSVLRSNIIQIAPHVWDIAPDPVKFRIGMIIDGYRTNLQNDRLALGTAFLKAVNGHPYETIPARTVALSSLRDRLQAAHEGRDNFYNEPPVMREILQYCKKADDIPPAVLGILTRTVVRCRIGRGLSYRNGVSPGGVPLYDQYLGMLTEAGAVQAIIALFHPNINSRLQNSICKVHLASVLAILRTRVVNDRLRAVVDALAANIDGAWNANLRNDFRELAAPYIRFS